MIPVKFPFRSVVTSVNGRVFTFTPEVFPGIVPAGGSKSMVGNSWVKTGVAVGGMLKIPEPLEVKNRPKIVLVEIGCTGVIQLTLALLEDVPFELDWTVSVP